MSEVSDTLRIQKLFKQLGVSDKEVLLLSEIAKHYIISVTELSKRTRIPRTSIYRYAVLWEREGYVQWVHTTQGQKLKISKLSLLKDSIIKEKGVLEKKESALEELEVHLKSIHVEARKEPFIVHYEGVEGIRQLIWNTLSSRTTLRVYTNVMRKEIVGSSWLEKYTREFVKRDLRDRVLGDTDYVLKSYGKYGGRGKYFHPVKEFHERSKERIIHRKIFDFKGEIYIYNNVVAQYAWDRNKLLGSEIEYDYLAQTQKALFDLLWTQTSDKDNIDNFIL